MACDAGGDDNITVVMFRLTNSVLNDISVLLYATENDLNLFLSYLIPQSRLVSEKNLSVLVIAESTGQSTHLRISYHMVAALLFFACLVSGGCLHCS